MTLRIYHFTTSLTLFIIFFAGCSGCAQKTEVGQADIDERPPPKGETHLTGHWMQTVSGDIWRRTAPIEKYDKNGIPKKFPRNEQGISHLIHTNMPAHLQRRYEIVKANNNNPDSNPNYYQEVYDTLCGELKPKDAAKFFDTYNIFNTVALRHMEDYQALKYIERLAEGYHAVYIADAAEYAHRIFEKKPKTQQSYETGMYLSRYKDVLKYHPNDTKASYKYARQLSENNPREAIKYMNKASKYKDKAVWHASLSHLYHKIGESQNATYHIKQALIHDRKNPDYMVRLIESESGRAWDDNDIALKEAFSAYWLEGQNEIDRAIRHINKAIEHDPNEPAWQQKLSELKKKQVAAVQ